LDEFALVRDADGDNDGSDDIDNAWTLVLTIVIVMYLNVGMVGLGLF